MKNLLVLIFFLFCGVCSAQKMAISSFSLLEDDLTANTSGTSLLDLNGDKCAIIKIETALTSLTFDVGILGVVETRQKNGEIWVYVPAGVKQISISHPYLGTIRNYPLGVSLEKARTYLLKLSEKSEDTNAPISDNGKLRRKVLLKLRANEELVYNECMLSFNTQDDHFACTIRDTVLNKHSFVIDGIKKITNADWILAHYIDPSDYNKCIVEYAQTQQSNGVYSKHQTQSIVIEGKNYGPYNGVLTYLYFQYAWFGIRMSDRQPKWLEKGIFSIEKRDDKERIEEKYLWGKPIQTKYPSFSYMVYNGDLTNDTIVSINQKYIALTKEYGSVHVNNKKIVVMPSSKATDYPYQHCAILDDGRCVFEFFGDDSARRFVVSGNVITELTDSQFFNYRTCSISDNKEMNNGYFLPSVYEDISQWEGQTTYHENHIVYDQTKTHFIESNAKYKYVLIDNKEYGNECAMGIWYKEAQNSFIWTTLEGDELVMYEYKI